MKSKLKSETFNNNKRGLKSKKRSVITKNLNWEILNKNWVAFERWDGAKYEKFWYNWGLPKNLILGLIPI